MITKKLHPQKRRHGFSPKGRCNWYGETSRALCFACRKCFHVNRANKCPECGGETYDAGTHFRPPKKRDIKSWKILELFFYATNARFYRYGNGPVPKNMRELLERIKSDRIAKLQWKCGRLWRLAK